MKPYPFTPLQNRKKMGLSLVSLALLLHSLTSFAVADKPDKPVTPVIVVPAMLESKTQPLETLGTLKAKQSIDVRANVSEILQSIHVTDGEQVKKGQLLFELSDQQEIAQLKQAEIIAKEAKRQFERAQKLRGQGNITEAVIDERKAAWQTADAELAIIKAQIDDRQIRAPFNGQVGLIEVSVGDLITPASILTTLDDLSGLLVDLQIPSQYRNDVHVAQTVEVFAPAPATLSRVYEKSQTPVLAKVSAISPRLHAETLLLPIRAIIDRPVHLKSGMVVRSQIQLRPEPKLWISNSSILMVGERQYVYRLKAAELKVSKAVYNVEKVEIKMGQRLAEFTEVIAGLQANDILVSQGVLRLSPKSQVMIKAIEGETPDDQLLKPIKTNPESAKNAVENAS